MLLATWGTADQPGPPGQPFNEPARAARSPQGDVFIADGYGQYRVHAFSADGTLQRSWGTKGTGPGEFGWPVHSVWVDPRDRLLVTDRENNRVQHFTLDGAYLGEWGDLGAPNDVCLDADETVYIAEGGPAITSRGPIRTTRGPGVTIMSLDGDIITQWGERGDGAGANLPPRRIACGWTPAETSTSARSRPTTACKSSSASDDRRHGHCRRGPAYRAGVRSPCLVVSRAADIVIQYASFCRRGAAR